MRIAAVCRVMNEDDIVEAFVRHTLAHVDVLLMLDNGSTDRTVEILTALKAEGAAITLMQVRSPMFHEIQHNTLLHGLANTVFQPDWVIQLDADEFLDTRQADLPTRLAALRPEVQVATLPMVDYFSRGLDFSELVVPRRARLRDLVDRGIRKCILRGGIPGQVVVGPGNQWAWVDGQLARTVELPELKLAHYSVRHPVTGVVKAALGRLKVLAAGGGPELTDGLATHYIGMFEALCRNPAEIFGDPARMNKDLPPFPLVDDPIHYAGDELRYTAPSDPVMQAIRSVANAAALLAESHGRLLDADPTLRDRVETEAMSAQLLFG